MSTLFDRNVRLLVSKSVPKDYKGDTVDAYEIDNLRVQFKFKKTLGKEPNTLEVSVYNLAPETRAALQGKGHKVVLSAGYGLQLEKVFAGDARLIESKKNGPDWITKIECGEGERAYNNARVSESFKPGAQSKDIIGTLTGSLGLLMGNSKDAAKDAKGSFSNGYVAHGNAANELDKILKSEGFEWSIQDGEIQILKPGQARNVEAVELSPDTGLIGSPEHGSPPQPGKPRVLKVKSLLIPRLRPGSLIKLVSREYKGNYRLTQVEGSGDTFGGDWYSDCECVPASGTK